MVGMVVVDMAELRRTVMVEEGAIEEDTGVGEVEAGVVEEEEEEEEGLALEAFRAVNGDVGKEYLRALVVAVLALEEVGEEAGPTERCQPPSQ